ncbi:hypothetical protein Glove_71g4 [Diversispora epigaea]|uniref:Uncharacterized protein n=1 Tax=Diversispora epigaea TaxID=1348612 RepID=A0A397JJ25_9GLOM|nr:hypothetical protein Glove_71g4 [Diversispora epigaea]
MFRIYMKESIKDIMVGSLNTDIKNQQWEKILSIDGISVINKDFLNEIEIRSSIRFLWNYKSSGNSQIYDGF